ncbi:MAG: UpxY family transcription antiterminator [Rikenellaceae bacterium]
MIIYPDHGVVWYAMKTTYKRELKAKEYLDTRGIESFIPMQKVVTIKYGKKTTTLKPAVHNLIFVKTDNAQLGEIKISLNYLHNCLTTINDKSTPIVVPIRQMEQFIKAVTEQLNKIAFIDLTKSILAKGTPVRITDGTFKGYEGMLNKIKGKRDRRVEINVEGIIAYTIDVEASFIEKI